MMDPKVADVIALAATMLLLLAMLALNHGRLRLASVFLVAGTAGVAATVGQALRSQDLWLLALAAFGLVSAAMVWPMYALVRTGRLNWIGRVLVARKLHAGLSPTGAPLQSMDQLRAEYGQTVLDDATRDPVLDDLLTQAARQFQADLVADASPLPLATQITLYANGMVHAFSESPETIAKLRGALPPDPRRRWRFPAYRDYAPFMLAVATLCRAYDSARVQRRITGRWTRLRPSAG